MRKIFILLALVVFINADTTDDKFFGEFAKEYTKSMKKLTDDLNSGKTNIFEVMAKQKEEAIRKAAMDAGCNKNEKYHVIGTQPLYTEGNILYYETYYECQKSKQRFVVSGSKDI